MKKIILLILEAIDLGEKKEKIKQGVKLLSTFDPKTERRIYYESIKKSIAD